MPTERVLAPGHDRERGLGRLALAWMAHFCVHGPGDIQGTPLRDVPLSLELGRLTADCYALDARGRRLYDSVFFSRPKGADKSGHAARLALFEALGPCRFAGWARGGEVFEWMDFRHVYEPGEAMGRPVTAPFLRCLATEEQQSGNVYDGVYFNLREGRLREAFNRVDDVGLTRVFLPGGGEIRPSTASSSAKEGGLETWCSLDETHLYTTPELRRMYATLRRNMGKRRDAEPWSFEASTMFEPGRDSIAERSHALALDIKEGRNRAARLLFDHRQAPLDTDLNDDAALRAALAEAYGDAAVFVPLDRIMDEIRDPRNDPADSRRYFLNQAVAGSARAFNLGAWAADPRRQRRADNAGF
jgi:hypothetical protein